MTDLLAATSCLSFHAPYRCRHAGACCAAPWQVRADEQVVRFVHASARYSGRTDELFTGQPARAGQPPELSVAKGEDGVCLFRQDRRCSIHTEGGESALPIGCRHYPRVVRIDREGITLSLSHYCPTAASLLASDAPVTIVSAGAPLALADPVEGLDAREALPPLLRPDVLMDLDAYRNWESAAVEIFATRRPDQALSLVSAAADELRLWKPGQRSFVDAVVQSFQEAGEVASPTWPRQGLEIAKSLNNGIVSLDGVPCDVDDPAVARVLGNYLAARVFGNWIAYQGRGLRTILTWIHACYDVARVLMCRQPLPGVAGALEAVRQADYVMLHTIDTQDFANAARGVEA